MPGTLKALICIFFFNLKKGTMIKPTLYINRSLETLSNLLKVILLGTKSWDWNLGTIQSTLNTIPYFCFYVIGSGKYYYSFFRGENNSRPAPPTKGNNIAKYKFGFPKLKFTASVPVTQCTFLGIELYSLPLPV